MIKRLTSEKKQDVLKKTKKYKKKQKFSQDEINDLVVKIAQFLKLI